MPTSEPKINIQTAASIINAVNSAPFPIYPRFSAMSLLCRNFNSLWCEALNGREEMGLKYFVMLHSDLGALSTNWLQHLLYLLELHDLDAISAVVPIKESKGEDTSTASAAIESGDRRRLSQGELLGCPSTFSAEWWAKEHPDERLLINTGMLAIRLDRPWSTELVFNIPNWITLDNESGQYVANDEPEDWFISRWFSERGIPYGCTTEIPVAHHGNMAWVMGGARK